MHSILHKDTEDTNLCHYKFVRLESEIPDLLATNSELTAETGGVRFHCPYCSDGRAVPPNRVVLSRAVVWVPSFPPQAY
jgi:hypothetical protein